jgi:hypothetical protein
MEPTELEDFLISIFPGFKKYWEDEDIHKHEDKSIFTHGIMTSFAHYYHDNYEKFDNKSLESFCKKIEIIVASDPNDISDVANAICTCFLEAIAYNKGGSILEPYLGKECKRYYDIWTKDYR